MNRQEIAEIRRRLNPEKNGITCVRGCYVDDKKQIVSEFNRNLNTLPPEEREKYIQIFKRVLSGMPGRNLTDIHFIPDEETFTDEHALLIGLRNTSLKVEEGVSKLYSRIIDALDMESHYLILLMHDNYDVPTHTKDGNRSDPTSEEVFSYMICCICPVKLTKPALSYCSDDSEFHARDLDWVVTAPELGFMFPTFDDRATNLYDALYFTKDASQNHPEFIESIFHTETPMPAEDVQARFQSALEEALDTDLSFDVAQTVHEQIKEIVENTGKYEQAPEISSSQISNVLSNCLVPEEKIRAFEEAYDEQFGKGAYLPATAVVNAKKFEVRTPDVVITVNPDRSDLVETRVIDGVKYILVRAGDGVAVNGVNVSIRHEIDTEEVTGEAEDAPF